MTELLAALAGAAIVGLLALAGVLWQTSRGHLESRRVADATRLGTFLAATHATVLEISLLAVSDMSEKATIELELHRSFADRVDTQLAAIQLLDNEDVVRAALALDKTIVLLGRVAKDRQWAEDDWRLARNEALSPALERFFVNGRASISRTSIPLHEITGWAWNEAAQRTTQGAPNEAPRLANQTKSPEKRVSP